MYVVKEDNSNVLVGYGPFHIEGRARDVAEAAAVEKPGTIFYVYKVVKRVHGVKQIVEQVTPVWTDAD